MKLEMALKIGACRGLTSVKETVEDITLHSAMLFPRDTAFQELKELHVDLVEKLGENWEEAKISKEFIELELEKLSLWLKEQK